MLSGTKVVQDDLLRAKQQLESEVENLRLEKRNAVRTSLTAAAKIIYHKK